VSGIQLKALEEEKKIKNKLEKVHEKRRAQEGAEGCHFGFGQYLSFQVQREGLKGQNQCLVDRYIKGGGVLKVEKLSP